jgi:hypothetical protein
VTLNFVLVGYGTRGLTQRIPEDALATAKENRWWVIARESDFAPVPVKKPVLRLEQAKDYGEA